MAARRPFWKWRRWKSIGFCLWPPSICIWNLKLKFQRKLDLCSGNRVVYRQTDRRTDGRTRWIQYTPPPTSLGGGIMTVGQVEYLQDLSDGWLRIYDFHISCIGFIYFRQVNGAFGQVIFTIHLPDGQAHSIWNFEACIGSGHGLLPDGTKP